MAPSPGLELDGLEKSYGERRALAGLSFAVSPGQMFGFVGPNGAGKITAMRIVLGVLAADSGEVRWNGQPVDADARRRVGYMPEERGLYPKMRVGEQVAYFAELHGLERRAAAAAAGTWLGRLGIAERAGEPVDKLSLGNQQRVQLAVALVHDPEVLVLDEPFSGVDPVGVDVLSEVLSERAAAGVPVIFSSHQLELVERLCDAVAIIAEGRLVATGAVEVLRARHGGRRLRVAVRDASEDSPARPGHPPAIARRARVVLELDEETDPHDVLDAARAAGRVEHFGWERPTLAELFREAVRA